MHWTSKDLEDRSGVRLVRFIDGRLFSVLPDRSKRNLTYTLGDEFGIIEGKPQHQGPLSEARLLSILNSEAAKPISLGDAQRVRAEHRVKVKQQATD
ncbi:MAG TPA: hypothetical protein VG897_08915 [Terriglobales bacterium]|nr:hypothetical protein [Terriglobales bacterium]